MAPQVAWALAPAVSALAPPVQQARQALLEPLERPAPQAAREQQVPLGQLAQRDPPGQLAPRAPPVPREQALPVQPAQPVQQALWEPLERWAPQAPLGPTALCPGHRAPRGFRGFKALRGRPAPQAALPYR